MTTPNERLAPQENISKSIRVAVLINDEGSALGVVIEGFDPTLVTLNTTDIDEIFCAITRMISNSGRLRAASHAPGHYQKASTSLASGPLSSQWRRLWDRLLTPLPVELALGEKMLEWISTTAPWPTDSDIIEAQILEILQD